MSDGDEFAVPLPLKDHHHLQRYTYKQPLYRVYFYYNMSNELERNVNCYFADVATSFIKFSFLGGVWGCFNPIPVAGSKEALLVAKTGNKFVPLLPFSSLASIGYYGGVIGCTAGVQRFLSGGMTLARGVNDVYNELVGVAGVYVYVTKILSSEKRVLWNNRIVAGTVVLGTLYSNEI